MQYQRRLSFAWLKSISLGCQQGARGGWARGQGMCQGKQGAGVDGGPSACYGGFVCWKLLRPLDLEVWRTAQCGTSALGGASYQHLSRKLFMGEKQEHFSSRRSGTVLNQPRLLLFKNSLNKAIRQRRSCTHVIWLRTQTSPLCWQCRRSNDGWLYSSACSCSTVGSIRRLEACWGIRLF